MKIDSATQERTFVADVPMDNPTAPSWVHDLPATENYIIVPDTPTVYDLKVCAAMLTGATHLAPSQSPGSALRSPHHQNMSVYWTPSSEITLRDLELVFMIVNTMFSGGVDRSL